MTISYSPYVDQQIAFARYQVTLARQSDSEFVKTCCLQAALLQIELALVHFAQELIGNRKGVSLAKFAFPQSFTRVLEADSQLQSIRPLLELAELERTPRSWLARLQEVLQGLRMPPRQQRQLSRGIFAETSLTARSAADDGGLVMRDITDESERGEVYRVVDAEGAAFLVDSLAAFVSSWRDAEAEF